MVSPATEASEVGIGHFSNMFDPGKKGLQLTDDSVTRLKNEFAANDSSVYFSYVPFSDDDTERPDTPIDGPNKKWIPCCAKASVNML